MSGQRTSSRLKLLPPYLFAELDRKKQKAIAKGADIISLSVGDPDIATPAPILKCICEEVKSQKNHCYPSGSGSRKLKEAIARWHSKRHGIRLDPDTQILVLIGSKEGIAHLPLALTDIGDTVLAPDPCYPPYKTGSLLSGARVVSMPLKEENGFLPDFDSIPRAVLSKTRLMFLNYPNNPTGVEATADFYRKAVALAKKHSFWIAQDAAYSEIYFQKPPSSIFETTGATDVAIEFYSLSKTFSMAGWRIGWACGNSRAIQALAQVKENIDSGAPGAIQEAAAFALANSDRFSAGISKEYARRKKLFSSALREMGWKLFDSKATFYLWAIPPRGMTSSECADILLEKAGVMVSPGNGFGPAGEGYVRFSLTVPRKRLSEAIERMLKISRHSFKTRKVPARKML